MASAPLHSPLESVRRPWPRPRAPWVMAQEWRDVLFAHWPVPIETLRPRIPRGLDLDLHDGQAWLGVVPFDLAMLRARGLPPIPGAGSFPELNVRTYVAVGGRPGVYFFSLDAASLLAVIGARTAFRLPYRHASMSLRREGRDVHYESRRRVGGASFRGSYAPVGAVFTATPGSFDEWLVERYCLYTYILGARMRLEIDHAPWPLQRAQATIRENTMTVPLGIPLDGDPVLHYAALQETVGWLPYPC